MSEVEKNIRILVVEDDRKTADLLLKTLSDAGYATCYAADGQAGLDAAANEKFDLAIVDIMLPVVDGFTVVETIRKSNINVPLIILSARTAVDDKVRGLSSGADLYLSKPFSVTELLANIQAQLRRFSMAPEKITTLDFADLHMDLLTRKVFRGGERIDLPPREFDLLEYLVRNANSVVTKNMIMENVWEYSFDPQTNIIETRIYKLREKVDTPYERKLIHTVRGVGYVVE